MSWKMEMDRYQEEEEQQLHAVATTDELLKVPEKAADSDQQSTPAGNKGKSGKLQTLASYIAGGIGMGVLNMPTAFTYVGWLTGLLTMLGCGFLILHSQHQIDRAFQIVMIIIMKKNVFFFI